MRIDGQCCTFRGRLAALDASSGELIWSSFTIDEPRQVRSRGGENDSPSRNLSRFLDSLADRLQIGLDVMQVWRNDRFGRGGDQVPFLAAGYPAVRLTEPNENYHRQHRDVRVEDGIAAKPQGILALLGIEGEITKESVNEAFRSITNFVSDIWCAPWYYESGTGSNVSNNIDLTVAPEDGNMVQVEECFEIASLPGNPLDEIRAAEEENGLNTG